MDSRSTKRPRSRPRSKRPPPGTPVAADIDALYGLEPVFEPGREASQALGMAAAFHRIECPYCGESFETLVDPGNGSATYIEDCQVCCQPIEFELRTDPSGALIDLSVRRS